MTNLDIIRKSRDLLNRKWLISIAVVFIYSLLTGSPSNIDNNFSIIVFIIGGALTLGLYIYFLNIIRGKDAGIEDLFD